MPGEIIVLKYPIPLFLFNWEGGNVSEYSDLGNCWQKNMRNDKNNAILKTVQPKFSPDWGENVGKIMSTWNLGDTIMTAQASKVWGCQKDKSDAYSRVSTATCLSYNLWLLV
jgi:hypothetical protein